jgi:FLVCR family MFS transporter
MEPSSRQQQKRPLLRDGSVNDAAPPRLFATRWWILLSFCALSFLQALCWNFYSPISFAAKELYGWSDNNIAWVANAANIAMLTSIPPSQYAAEAFGSRLPTVVCALMMLVCTGLRCLPSLLLDGQHGGGFSDSPGMLWLMVASMIFNGWAAAWLNFAGPILSASWFALDERATVTAIITCTPYVGVSAGFVLGPLLMEPADFPAGCGGGHLGGSSAGGSGDGSADGGSGGACPGSNTLYMLYYAEAAAAALVFLAVLLHFPAKPPTPPTRSAAVTAEVSEERAASDGFRQVFCECSQASAGLWTIAFAFAMPLGVYSGWGAVLAINLEEFGISALAAGWLGCAMTLIGCLGGVVIGALTDRFRGNMKFWILLCDAISTGAFLWFALIILGVVEGSRTTLYATGTVGGAFLNAPIPLFFELVIVPLSSHCRRTVSHIHTTATVPSPACHVGSSMTVHVANRID